MNESLKGKIMGNTYLKYTKSKLIGPKKSGKKMIGLE